MRRAAPARESAWRLRDREGSEQGLGLAADRASFVDSVHSRASAHRRILPREIPRSEVPDAALAEPRAPRAGIRRRSARDDQDHQDVAAGGLTPLAPSRTETTLLSRSLRASWILAIALAGLLAPQHPQAAL